MAGASWAPAGTFERAQSLTTQHICKVYSRARERYSSDCAYCVSLSPPSQRPCVTVYGAWWQAPHALTILYFMAWA
eukprot:scaffold102653_cov54-Phaeocystis_antarctica.AAC.2